MVNHFYDSAPPRTRCGDYEGTNAVYFSSNYRVSCPRCRDALKPDERVDQWYPFDDDEA